MKKLKKEELRAYLYFREIPFTEKDGVKDLQLLAESTLNNYVMQKGVCAASPDIQNKRNVYSNKNINDVDVDYTSVNYLNDPELPHGYRNASKVTPISTIVRSKFGETADVASYKERGFMSFSSNLKHQYSNFIYINQM